ncbi:AMT1-1 [Symbiodinium necroappetens]|uniref:AMT1-1 protein n=1 Tax=Symbiodinium necroappetens TaxID=1628268 RepID=A0A813A2B0_9DINO|nr:AMT1-1 [Symbiodinium necroappetens]
MLRQLAEELSEQLDVARKQQRHSDASQATTCPSDGGPSSEDFLEAQEEEPEEESPSSIHVEHGPGIDEWLSSFRAQAYALGLLLAAWCEDVRFPSYVTPGPQDHEVPPTNMAGLMQLARRTARRRQKASNEAEHGPLAERADGACQTDGEGCTASEQWAPSHENAEDGEWVVLPEDANDEEHQLGEERAACSSNFAEDAGGHFCVDEGRLVIFDSVHRIPRCIMPDGLRRLHCVLSQGLWPVPRDFRDAVFDVVFALADRSWAIKIHVQELLNWRLLSRRTRSPKVLIQHVAEMGSMDRPEAIVAFAEKVTMFFRNPETSFAAALRGHAETQRLYESAFGGDATQQKLYESRSWCMALAANDRVHFAEIDVRRIVGNNLESLLWHCRSADASVADAAGLLVYNYASDAISFVQQTIVEATLGMMEDFIKFNIPANLEKIQTCIGTLAKVLRWLSKPQRQQWVSLMVKLLMDHYVSTRHVIRELKMLWLADDDPKRTYAEAVQQLWILADSDRTGEVKSAILSLLYSS